MYNQLLDKKIRLFHVIVCIITIWSFLFNALFIDASLAANIIPANKAKTSQLRPYATAASPGIVERIRGLFRRGKGEDSPVDTGISDIFLRLQEAKELGNFRKPSPEKAAIVKDLKIALSNNRNFKPDRSQFKILLSSLMFESYKDNHGLAAALAECADSCLLNNPNVMKEAYIYKLMDAIYNFDESGPGVDAVSFLLGRAAASNLDFVYDIIHKKRIVLTTLDGRSYYNDFDRLVRGLGMYAVKSKEAATIINRLLNKLAEVKTAALAQFLEHLFAKYDELFKIPGLLVSVLDTIEKIKDAKIDPDRGSPPVDWLVSIFYHSLEKYPDSIVDIVSILKAKGNPELTKMFYWIILNYLSLRPTERWPQVEELLPAWFREYEQFLIKYMHLLYNRTMQVGILSGMIKCPTPPYYFEFLYLAEDETDLKGRIRACEYFLDIELYSKGKVTLTAETFGDLVRWYNLSRVFDYSLAIEFLSFSKEERENYFSKHDEELRRIRAGGFDKTNPLHILLGYEILIQEIRNHPAIKKDISYRDYKEYLEKPKKDLTVFDKKERAEISYLADETIRLRNFIGRVKDRADELGMPLVVIENLTYGWIATLAIEDELEAMGIKIIKTKAGSTYAHDNPTAMHGLGGMDDADLFEEEDFRYLVENEHLAVVVDGTYSLGPQKMQQFRRRSARFPDAHQPYRNNYHALSGSPSNADFAMQDLRTQKGVLVSDALEKSRLYNMVREKANSIKPASQRPNYKMFFWYPGKKSLEVDSERRGRPVPENLTLNNPSNPDEPFINKIRGPALIFAVANMENHMIDKRVKVKGVYHNSAYFDDKEPFGRVFVDITPYGPKVSEAFSIAVTNEYQRLKEALGMEELAVRIAKEPEFVSIQAIIADFDNTLVLFPHAISQSTVQYLETLLSLGVHIAIITGGREENMKERLWSRISPHLRRRLHIFSNGGTCGFGFNEKGEKVTYFTYKINPEVGEHILDVVGQTLPAGSYKVEPRDYKVKLKIKDKKKRREYADLLNRAFLKEGMNVTISFDGRHHISLFTWSKVDAARYFEEHILRPAGITLEDTLVMVNEVRSYGIDRPLFEVLDTSWRVNVGSASPTLHGNRIFHLHRQGPPASNDILADIARHGGNLDLNQLPYTPPISPRGESAFEMAGGGETVKYSSAAAVSPPNDFEKSSASGTVTVSGANQQTAEVFDVEAAQKFAHSARRDHGFQFDTAAVHRLGNILMTDPSDLKENTGWMFENAAAALLKALRDEDRQIKHSAALTLEKVLTSPKDPRSVYASTEKLIMTNRNLLNTVEDKLLFLDILEKVLLNPDLSPPPDYGFYESFMNSCKDDYSTRGVIKEKKISIMEKVLTSPNPHPAACKAIIRLVESEAERNPAFLDKSVAALAAYFVYYDNYPNYARRDDEFELSFESSVIYDISIVNRYRTDQRLLRLRWLLLTGRFDNVRETDYRPDEIAHALLLNNMNSIFSRASNLTSEYAGKKTGILKGMAPLEPKTLNKPYTLLKANYILISTYKPYTLSDFREELIKAGVDFTSSELEEILNVFGFRSFKIKGALNILKRTPAMIIPTGFNWMSSAYRGSTEQDNTAARHLTHSLMTAFVRYANSGGEAAAFRGREEELAYGRLAYHEFDISTLLLEGEDKREIDEKESLSFNYPKGANLPYYSCKRTVRLEGKTMREHLEDLNLRHIRERRTKRTILNILEAVCNGKLNPQQLSAALGDMQDAIKVLRSEEDANQAYLDYVYGYLDQSFYAQLKDKYREGFDNTQTLKDLMLDRIALSQVVLRPARNGNPAPYMVPHPWAAQKLTLLDYLRREEKIMRYIFKGAPSDILQDRDIYAEFEAAA